MLKAGMTAPDFELPVSTGGTLRLSNIANEKTAVILAFYLMDFSGG